MIESGYSESKVHLSSHLWGVCAVPSHATSPFMIYIKLHCYRRICDLWLRSVHTSVLWPVIVWSPFVSLDERVTANFVNQAVMALLCHLNPRLQLLIASIDILRSSLTLDRCKNVMTYYFCIFVVTYWCWIQKFFKCKSLWCMKLPTWLLHPNFHPLKMV
jgi:hypothetical protein